MVSAFAPPMSLIMNEQARFETSSIVSVDAKMSTIDSTKQSKNLQSPLTITTTTTTTITFLTPPTSFQTTTVKLQWIKEPPKEMVVSVNQELKLDCLAQGEPKPMMRWEKLPDHSSGGSLATSLSSPKRHLFGASGTSADGNNIKANQVAITS